MSKTVVRNAQYRRGGLSVRQRHNERQNADYMNGDIVKDRAALNVRFKQCGGSYEQMFDALLADGAISTRGLGKDPHIVDELVFDVNTAYFEDHGGYEFARFFFEEAYRCAVEEIGGEQYVLSAVMHADERNKALSEQLGRDVFHYHLHVVYVPVVDKAIYFKKNNKDPEKAGKLREVIKQVSHSKKWPKRKRLDEHGEVMRSDKGKALLVNAYSLLQDHFYEHMKEAGFRDFERGERGSTAEHLSVLEYKSKQETERAAALERQAEKKRKRLEKLDDSIAVKTKAAATAAEIDAMGKPALLGGFSVSADDMQKLKTLAKKSVTADERVMNMKRKLTTAERERDELQAEKAAVKRAQPSITEHLTMFNKYSSALKRDPKRLAATVEDILRQPPQRREQEQATPERRRATGLDI